ncbi:MAG: glucokinase [Cyanobacteria bacterium P01_A01_bin.135]
MTQLLAGDIGGTKTILRLVKTGPGDKLETLHEARYISGDYPDLVPMVQQFFEEALAKTGVEANPARACFAIAGPVANNVSSLTNLSWLLEGDRLEKTLKIPQVELINDFAAVGYGVVALDTIDLHTLQEVPRQANAPVAVIGAGTGLGQGFLIPQAGQYWVYPSEGGHADFAPRSELEFQLLLYLRDKFNITRISAERVVSGQGIVAIYQFLRDRQMAEESPEVAKVVREWERQTGMKEKTVDPAAAIAQSAASNTEDYLSDRTMQIFAGAYGAEAGNLALKLLPYGGLYIAGGVAAKNLKLMQEGSFMQAFSEKGRVSTLLENVPVHIVLNPNVGLIGAAQYAAAQQTQR